MRSWLHPPSDSSLISSLFQPGEILLPQAQDQTIPNLKKMLKIHILLAFLNLLFCSILSRTHWCVFQVRRACTGPSSRPAVHHGHVLHAGIEHQAAGEGALRRPLHLLPGGRVQPAESLQLRGRHLPRVPRRAQPRGAVRRPGDALRRADSEGERGD